VSVNISLLTPQPPVAHQTAKVRACAPNDKSGFSFHFFTSDSLKISLLSLNMFLKVKFCEGVIKTSKEFNIKFKIIQQWWIGFP